MFQHIIVTLPHSIIKPTLYNTGIDEHPHGYENIEQNSNIVTKRYILLRLNRFSLVSCMS